VVVKTKGYRALGTELIPVYIQAVSPLVTLSHPPGGRLPLLFTRPAVTFPAEECRRLLAGTQLYCLVIKAHACEQAFTWKRTGRDSNLRPFGSRANALPLCHTGLTSLSLKSVVLMYAVCLGHVILDRFQSLCHLGQHSLLLRLHVCFLLGAV